MSWTPNLSPQLSAELAQTARKRCSLDNDVKVFGVLGPICESHQPGTTKTFVESYGKFELHKKRSKGF